MYWSNFVQFVIIYMKWESIHTYLPQVIFIQFSNSADNWYSPQTSSTFAAKKFYFWVISMFVAPLGLTSFSFDKDRKRVLKFISRKKETENKENKSKCHFKMSTSLITPQWGSDTFAYRVTEVTSFYASCIQLVSLMWQSNMQFMLLDTNIMSISLVAGSHEENRPRGLLVSRSP